MGTLVYSLFFINSLLPLDCHGMLEVLNVSVYQRKAFDHLPDIYVASKTPSKNAVNTLSKILEAKGYTKSNGYLYRSFLLQGIDKPTITSKFVDFFYVGLKLDDVGEHPVSYYGPQMPSVYRVSSMTEKAIFFAKKVKHSVEYMRISNNNGIFVFIVFDAKSFANDSHDIFSHSRYKKVNEDIPGKYIKAIFAYNPKYDNFIEFENPLTALDKKIKEGPIHEEN